MSDESDDRAKKLAHEIRTATDSMELDLAGYGADQCDRLAAAAFSKPLPLASMIRLSFLVGGGKKVRQKYNDGLPALFAEALKRVGYSEDRGASLDPSCAGLFKYQHNTDTDLKLLLFSEMPTFQRMVAAKTPSLAQRRRALTALKGAREQIATIEGKLASMQALTEDEQQLYDTLDAALVEEKVGWLSKQMELMIDQGQLTASERTQVMSQLASKVEQLEAQLASAQAEGKAKRTEKLQAMLVELRTRCTSVSELKPITRKVKFEAEIKAAQKRLAELEKLENSKIVLPLAEVQKLNAKPKLLEDLQAMQAESKGWFAED